MTSSINHNIVGTIATVVINNPTKMNSISLEGWKQFGQVLRNLSANNSLRCIILRGEGDRAFSAGADISEFSQVRKNSAQAASYGAVVAAGLKALRTCVHPTLAAIQGVCTGGGLEIACGCDLRIANTSAKFGIPINKLGHAFAFAEMQTVLDSIDRNLLLELILEGRIINSDEALNRGIVNRVIENNLFDDEIIATVKRITEGAPLVNRAVKKFLARLGDPTPLREEEITEGYALCDTNDYAEGVRAFLSKKKPVFEGN
ncbi:MAG: enoyl-CoA hydratase-related protein [Pseudomonadota bacterium]|nr:enoyl-CoA hydratase-related protein [Pseudomonadota bacterium]